MPEYTYEALDPQGRTVRGLIEPSSEGFIFEQLRAMGYEPISATENRKPPQPFDIFSIPGMHTILAAVKVLVVMLMIGAGIVLSFRAFSPSPREAVNPPVPAQNKQ
jgi:type II secretory pathway component PulF